MIPVVMEERVRNTSTWDGEVGLTLGGRLYVDMCGDVFEDEYIDRCTDDLYSKIIKIIKKPIKGLAYTASMDNNSAETMPKQMHLQLKKHKEKENVKPLKELTIDEVSVLLESNKLGKYVAEMKDNEVDGETLMVTNDETELKELGISLAPKARMFFKKLEEYKCDGVPFSLLGMLEEDEDEEEDEGGDDEGDAVTGKNLIKLAAAAKYGDGSFTISGASGECAGRINGAYEISDEMQNGLPVYSKQGDDDTFIELVKGVSGWRWYLKKKSDKGPNNSICFAYCQCLDDDVKLPSQTDHSDWHIYANKEFVVQTTVCISSAPGLLLPANISQLLTQARATIKAAKEELEAEVRLCNGVCSACNCCCCFLCQLLDVIDV
jgi:hypothetical protein